MAIYGTLGGQDSTSTGYPSIRPTLDLNFAQTKTLDPRVTFYRDSLGTYTDSLGIVRTVPANVPRFDHNPTTGESLGLLIEESRTNLYTYSDQFDNIDWTKNQVTVTANQGTAPDGTATADLVTTNTVNAYNTLDQLPTLSTNTNYCYSVFVKLVSGSGTSSRVVLAAGNISVSPGYASWGLQLDNLAETTDGNTPNIKGYISYPNGWYRIYMVINTSSQTNANVAIRFGTGNVDVVSTFYLWGAQLETGSFPTSYIPTSGSTVTRSADACYIDGTNFSSWYNSIESSAFIDVLMKNSNGAVGLPAYGFKTSSNSNYYYGFSRDNVNPYHYVNTSNVNSYLYGTLSSDGNYKACMTWKQNDINSYINSVQNYNTTSATLFTPDILYLGAVTNTSNILNGNIRRFTYYPKRLTNTQLQNLTA